MAKLKAIIERHDNTWGKRFDIFIQILILISLISFTFETLPNLDPDKMRILRLIEIFCVSVFTVEYILRIAVADKPLRFILSLYGIFDLLAILPFYLTSGMDLRSLRAFRFLRIFQLFKLSRYNKAMNRLIRAMRMIREEFFLFFFVAIILIYFSAMGIYYLESEAQPDAFRSVFESLWWAVCTLTTVGYGDIYPITTGGKIFTYGILILGLAIVAIPAGLVSSALSEVRREDYLAEKERKTRQEDAIREALTK